MCLIYRKNIPHLKLLSIICSAYIITNCFLEEWIILGRKDVQTLQLRISTELWGSAIQNPNVFFFHAFIVTWWIQLSFQNCTLDKQSNLSSGFFPMNAHKPGLAVDARLGILTHTCVETQSWKFNVVFTQQRYFSLYWLYDLPYLFLSWGTGTTYFLHKRSFSIW